jgi:hypothetical protein
MHYAIAWAMKDSISGSHIKNAKPGIKLPSQNRPASTKTQTTLITAFVEAVPSHALWDGTGSAAPLEREQSARFDLVAELPPDTNHESQITNHDSYRND